MVKCVEEQIIITQLSLVAFLFSLFFSLYIIVMSFSFISPFSLTLSLCVSVLFLPVFVCLSILLMSDFESMFNLPEFWLTNTSFFYYFKYNNKSLLHAHFIHLLK